MSLFISAGTFLVVAVTFLLNRYTAKAQGSDRLAVVALVIAIFCFVMCAASLTLGAVSISGVLS